ncbi:heterogeneous nuclear ribonucleoprotein Q [Malania oleifera]|uniref:heterogeneous nuclear ribonucleoprotein Q n=1 Tax=Malania oleifera TaxID=397392 RepID=UPI0025ADEAFA|nr:heterogeneous nuclear ribonucleoprotein Q [Malania oleifera]XP_057960862.1 heterogeneous nuclear ribonucleoprotein Q [Malania oleifera]XP_057960870.1 heterogeneous nuclear ribonucleoprotein Q [Malania oleifera]
MPRTRARSAAARKPDVPEKHAEPEKPVESEEQVETDGDNNTEEMEEEVEYEEVEEEEEVEEVEEEEEEEEEVEEEVEEDEEEEEDEADAERGGDSDEEMKAVNADEDEIKKHAELLALPPHGSEVYLGGIPYDTSEDDLRGFCESVGEVTEIRIMKGKDSSENKGYAFVTFKTKELASKAMEKLNNAELKGKKIKCSTSQAKHRLFIGNVPRNWGEEDMKKIVTEIGPGVNAVELLKDPQNSSRNRGFAFIEYYNHACAEYSRQKMSTPKFKLDNNAPTVSWADPKNPESSAASQVKAVYVKNLPKDITQDQLRKLFEHHGKITKVVLPPAKAGQENSRFGFVHFAERSSAMKALKNTEKYEIDGQALECSLAKPQADQKSSGGPNSQKSALLPSYPPRAGYGMVGGAYGVLGAGYSASGAGQSMIYGRGATPAGMAMMPMLLPDGRIGYVLQQPGAQSHTPPQHRGDRSGGGGGLSRGRRGSDGSRGNSRYNPY